MKKGMKGYTKVIPSYSLIFYFRMYVNEEVKIQIFSDATPRPIQSNSSSHNVHNKDGGLKPLWNG